MKKLAIVVLLTFLAPPVVEAFAAGARMHSYARMRKAYSRDLKKNKIQWKKYDSEMADAIVDLDILEIKVKRAGSRSGSGL